MRPIEYYQTLAKRIYFIDRLPYWNRNAVFKRLYHKVAGSINSDGYRIISVTLNNKPYQLKAHSLHWFMVYGIVPKKLDHKDRIKDNNRIDNLREGTPSQHVRNRELPPGTSKYIGVNWHKRSEKWYTRIRINYKRIDLGYWECEHCAGYAYDRALIKYGLEEFGIFNFPLEI